MRPAAPQLVPATPRAFRCRCGRPVFFDNHVCLGCGTPLGYVPQRMRLLPLQAGPLDGTWRPAMAPDEAEIDPQALYRRCANAQTAAHCNWLVRDDAPDCPAATLCHACRLNRVIPHQGSASNQLLWGRVERAKRRLVSSLLALGLPLASRIEDPLFGLAFDLLAPTPGQPITTGHACGVITVNLDEADHAKREQHRENLHEPYRTLLGHLRHEVGHHYWSRLVEGSAWHAPFQTLFGDERTAYPAALQRHYAQGPPPDWSERHVSAYASAHPWEDWAETWAHYLHLVDSLDTALSFGLRPPELDLALEPFDARALGGPDDGFLALLNAWIRLNGVLNELCRSMGQADFYPFVLSATAVAKLHFVHRVVRQHRPMAPR
jgi:hypothetical protein